MRPYGSLLHGTLTRKIKYIRQSIKWGCIGVLRTHGHTADRKGHSNRKFHKDTSLDYYTEKEDSLSLEESIILNTTVSELITRLDLNELIVISLFLSADNIEKITLDDIRIKLRLKWPQQAKRIKVGIQEKYYSLVTVL
jgi:hypothetical protein